MKQLCKRSDVKEEISSTNRFIIWFKREVILSTLKVVDIRWDSIYRKIIHAFIKASMSSKFHSGSIHIIPEDIPGGVRHKTRKMPFRELVLSLAERFPGGQT